MAINNIIYSNIDENKLKVVVYSLQKKEYITRLFEILKQEKQFEIHLLGVKLIPFEIVIMLEKIKTKIKIISNEKKIAYYFINLGFKVVLLSSISESVDNIFNNIEYIALGGSAGSLQKFIHIVKFLPKSYVSFFIIMHQKDDQTNLLPQILQKYTTTYKVKEAVDGDLIEKSTIYVAPTNKHLLVKNGKIVLNNDQEYNFSKPSLSVSFNSMAEEFRHNFLAIIVCGYGKDGSDSLYNVKKHGGKVIIEQPFECEATPMLENAINTKQYDHILTVSKISQLLFQKLNENKTLNDNIDDFLKQIYLVYGYDYRQYNKDHLLRRISRLNSLKMESEKRLADHKKVERSNIDLKSAEDEYKRLKEKLDSLQLSIGKQEQTLEQNIKNKIKHREKIDELNREREEFKVCQKMKELIGSANGAKFARFAQSITLEQLIQLANSHLNILNQRYILIYNKEENQESLDISIIDTFQADTVRAVSTLSGGESFIISLALALGLSELASQKISIESLFLDEGFGTLDEENLEMAINALNTLQSKGKMVGVISHIEALKERIPTQIKVIANGDGTSRVEV